MAYYGIYQYQARVEKPAALSASDDREHSDLVAL